MGRIETIRPAADPLDPIGVAAGRRPGAGIEEWNPGPPPTVSTGTGHPGTGRAGTGRAESASANPGNGHPGGISGPTPNGRSATVRAAIDPAGT